MFMDQERLVPEAESVPMRPELALHTDASHDDFELQPLQNAPVPMTPVTQDTMFNQTNQFKEYKMTQKQLSSELKDIMGQLSERALHQESNLAQKGQELAAHSARNNMILATSRNASRS